MLTMKDILDSMFLNGLEHEADQLREISASFKIEILNQKDTIRKRNLMIKQLRENIMNQRLIIARLEKDA